MVEYDYSVREVVRDPETLRKELEDLGDQGWELVTILEKSLPYNITKTKTGWVIVSKKVLEQND